MSVKDQANAITPAQAKGELWNLLKEGIRSENTDSLQRDNWLTMYEYVYSVLDHLDRHGG